MVIYEEYRQHAQVFTLRCMSVFIVATLYPESPCWVAPIIVMAHHLLADRITAIHGSNGNTAVRATSEKMELSPFYQQVAKLYSFYQFLAIASHILPNDDLAGMAYNALIAIQSSAFMMTLYRKRIIRGKTHMVVYASCLILSAFHIVRSIGVKSTLLVVAAFYTRINLPRAWGDTAKYAVWTTFLAVYWIAVTAAWEASWLPLEGHQMPVLQMPDAGVLKGAVTAVLVYGAARAERVLGAEEGVEVASTPKAEGTDKTPVAAQ